MFSCSCFIDQSVWFVNSIAHSWKFDSLTCVDGVVSDKLFIYKKDFTFVSLHESIQYINEIIVCCLECFEFILTYFSSKEEMCDVFNELDCWYVIDDQFCFNSEIYIGNDQFMTLNANLNREQREDYIMKQKRNWIFFLKSNLKQNLVLLQFKNIPMNFSVLIVKEFSIFFF